MKTKPNSHYFRGTSNVCICVGLTELTRGVREPVVFAAARVNLSVLTGPFAKCSEWTSAKLSAARGPSQTSVWHGQKLTHWQNELTILKKTLPPCPALSHCRPGFQNRYYQAYSTSGSSAKRAVWNWVHSGSAWLRLTLFVSHVLVTFVTFVTSVARQAATRAPVCWSTIRRGASVNMSRQRFKTAEFNGFVLSMFDENLNTLFFVDGFTNPQK